MPSLRGFISRQVARITNAAQTIFHRANTNVTNVGSSAMNFSISSNAGRSAAGTYARMQIYLDPQTQAGVLHEIGRRGVGIIQDTLAPIRRTGSLERSIKYNVDVSQRMVTIYSDHPAASSLVQGYTSGGSIDALTEWMQHKAEFASLPDNEQKEAAFLIRRAIENGQSPGPRSTLAALNPSGERRFDFLSDAEQQISDMIRDALQEVIDGAA